MNTSIRNSRWAVTASASMVTLALLQGNTMETARAVPLRGVARQMPAVSAPVSDNPKTSEPSGGIYDGKGGYRSTLKSTRDVPIPTVMAPFSENPNAPKPVWASDMVASSKSRIAKSPRIERLRRILGGDALRLPPPPKEVAAFSAKIIDRLSMEDALSAAITQSYKLAAAESRHAYSDALTGVARAALLPQVKLKGAHGWEKTGPGADTYSYAKKDICYDTSTPDAPKYQDCASGGTTVYRTGEKVPTSALLRPDPRAAAPDASLLTGSFAYDSIKMTRDDYSLSVTQSLFDYSAWAEVARQNRVQEANKYAAQGERLKVTLDAATSYLKLFQNSLALRFAEDYEKALNGLYERISARVTGGASSETDSERVKGRRVNAHSTVLDARNAIEVELTAFQKLTGMRPSQLALPSDWLEPMPDSVEAALELAANTNPALQADLKQTEAILAELKKAKGGFLPTVGLEYSLSNSRGAGATNVPIVTASSCIDRIAGDPVCDDGGNQQSHTDKRTQSLMLVLNWNIFSGGADYYQNKATAEKYNEAMFRLLDTRRETEEKLRANFESLSSTAARVEEIAKEVEANQKVVESFIEQMFAANRSLLDVLDAHQRLYQSRLDYLRLLVAEATLAYDALYNIGTLTQVAKAPEDAVSPRGWMGSLVGQDVWRKR